MKLMSLILAVLVLALVPVGVLADGMLSRDYSIEVVDTATNTQTLVARGWFEGLYIDCPANATGTVSVATRGATIFSIADVAADVTYYPRVEIHNSTGTVVSADYEKIPLEGEVTAQVIGGSTGTNTWAVEVIFRP